MPGGVGKLQMLSINDQVDEATILVPDVALFGLHFETHP